MKATKLTEKTRISCKFFWLIYIAVMFASCDVLESDPDVLEPDVDLTGKEVFVLANSASFIDLNSRLQTNVPARVAVTSEPRHGKLTDLGKGILQYSPSVGNSRARDGFEFTVYTASNEIIKRDSVIIIIENDSTKLPCNIYPLPDYVYGVKTAPVLIEVMANDVICADSVILSVYKPVNSFPPYYGTAAALDKVIKYTPGSQFEGVDKIMYKITAASDTSRIAYGIVYITGDSSCSFRLTNDLYVYNEDAVDSLLTLPVFTNDSLCQSINEYQVNVKLQPVYGQVSAASNGFHYKVPASVTFPFTDFFMYEVCIDATCKVARVDVMLKKDSVIACTLKAISDSVNIVYSDSLHHYFDVLKNDSLCGNLKNLKITKAPVYGTATVSIQRIFYQRDPQQKKDDTLEYEICNNVGCSKATVLIKQTK